MHRVHGEFNRHEGIAGHRVLRHDDAMRVFCLMLLVLTHACPGGVAALKDILNIDESKANAMADLRFDAKEFRIREFQGTKEFKTEKFNSSREFRANRTFDPGGRELGTPVTEVFTGTSSLGGEARIGQRSSPLTQQRYELPDRAAFSRETNPLGDRTFHAADRRYVGPEMKRRTREIEIINQALKTKEGAEGRTLTMEEVRAVLNSYE